MSSARTTATHGRRTRASVTNSVAELYDAALHPFDRAGREPLERRAEEHQMIALPHRVVRRAAEVDEHLLLRAQVLVELVHALGCDLLVVDAGHHEHRHFDLLDRRLAEAPDRRVRRAAHALPPRRANRVGREHRAPDRVARGLLVLILAADLPVPAGDEV